jgi:signal transduction histidine kinase
VEETGETVATADTHTGEKESELVTRMSPFTRSTISLEHLYQSENSLLLDYIAQLGTQLQDLAESTHVAMEKQVDDGARQALLKIKEELHSLLSPLSSITGYHDLLISESVGNLTEMQQRFLDRIRSAAEKLHQSIDEIEQVADTGLPALPSSTPPSYIRLQDLVDESFKSFQQLIQDRRLEVRIIVPNDLPKIHGKREEIQPIVQKILNSLLSISSDGSNIKSRLSMQVELNGKRNVLWKTTSQAQANNLPAKELDEFSEYLQENVFSLAERLDCQLWMDASVHTERQVNLLFPAE